MTPGKASWFDISHNWGFSSVFLVVELGCMG